MFLLKKILPLLLFPCLLTAQVQDDFSDGDLTENPTWQGGTGDFTVNAELELQLDAPAAGTSTLYLPVELADSAVWEMLFRLDFDPSGSNKLLIALQSDSETFAAGSGYFLEFGESGSEDAIRFFRQDAGSETLLATATLGAVASSPEVRLRMERQADGTWTLLADYSGSFNYSEEFQVSDVAYGNGSYFFGMECEYTDSRKDKFFFDDILIDELLPDLEAPTLLSATPLSATEVDVVFNEPLDEISATEPMHFYISGGIGNPAAAFLDSDDKTLVHLSLATPLTSQSDYTLTAEAVVDLSGNISASQTAGFSFLEIEMAVQFDILINELMVDPNPVIGLPDAEFVELFNRSGKIIDLGGMGLTNGGSPQALPNYLLFPDSYAIVCDEDFEGVFLPFGNVVTLGSFPGLTNSGDEVALVNSNGEIIHGIRYTLDTYGDLAKSEGGWSLEMINPLSPCTGERNFRAAENLIGGTPGQANSVLNEQLDDSGPTVERVFASQTTLEIFFDEYLEKTVAEDVSRYQISNGVTVVSATVVPPENEMVRLTFAAPLETNLGYELQISEGLTDCLGNTAGAQTLTFALPLPIGKGELLINEILFDPPAGGGDFLEIFNPSDKIFNLGDLVIARMREGIDTSLVPVVEDRLIYPGEYAVITPAIGNVLDFFEAKNPEFILRNSLPPFNADAGNVTLIAQRDSTAAIVDAFDYHEDMHAPLLDEAKGISLERIDPNRPAQDASNWHSAASTVGYATPTYLNSQYLLSGTPTADDFFDIPEKKLSPDGDGFQDFLVVNYQTDQSGYSVRAEVFDAEGRLVKSLFDNELLATEGFFRWDGDTDRGEKARTGIYILWIQLFHPDGSVREFKETCVVAF